MNADARKVLIVTGSSMTNVTLAEIIWYFVSGAPNVTGEQLVLDGGASLAY